MGWVHIVSDKIQRIKAFYVFSKAFAFSLQSMFNMSFVNRKEIFQKVNDLRDRSLRIAVRLQWHCD